MTTKHFDCVEMKRQAQKSLRKEYKERRQEFASYDDFLHARAEETTLWQELRKRRASPPR
jgi:hypothetical protein